GRSAGRVRLDRNDRPAADADPHARNRPLLPSPTDGPARCGEECDSFVAPAAAMSETQGVPSRVLPSALYARGVAENRWQDDPAQRAALEAFDRLHDALLAPSPGMFERLRARFAGHAQTLRGLYLWGAVGRGKTMLMDQFAASLPAGLALRDPLPRVAAGIAARSRVLCLDEFMVADIGDAMILYGLLRALVERCVTLVTTSNTPPRDLYRNGLQRERFLPAIALLEQHCEVLEIAS